MITRSYFLFLVLGCLAGLIAFHSQLPLYQSRLLQSNFYNQRLCSSVIDVGSLGVETAIEYLNSPTAQDLLNSFALNNIKLKEDIQKANFWTNGNFVIQSSLCVGIVQAGLQLEVTCLVKGKSVLRSVSVPFPTPVTNEEDLKTVLVRMTTSSNRIRDTGSIMKLPFGQDVSMPKDFLFNNVPHAAWVRAYLYQSAADAVVKAICDDRIKSKSRLQLRVNIPEVSTHSILYYQSSFVTSFSIR